MTSIWRKNSSFESWQAGALPPTSSTSGGRPYQPYGERVTLKKKSFGLRTRTLLLTALHLHGVEIASICHVSKTGAYVCRHRRTPTISARIYEYHLGNYTRFVVWGRPTLFLQEVVVCDLSSFQMLESPIEQAGSEPPISISYKHLWTIH